MPRWTWKRLVMRVPWPVLAAALVAAAACGGEGGPDLPDLTPFDPALTAKLHDIRAKVSEIRGLPPNQQATEGVVTREAFMQHAQKLVQELGEEEKAELEAQTVALRLLRLIRPEDDLLQLLTEGYGGDILGLYLPETRQLVLIGESGEIGMQGELTLAHEYAHSLQDGAFGLESFRKKWAKSDSDRKAHSQYGVTARCLFEGDAELTERLYAEQVFGSDWEEQLQEEQQEGENPSATVPAFLALAELFDYRECEEFVTSLHDEGGWELVNQAYKKPPATTEQVLHPEKYKSGQLGNGQGPRDLLERLGEDWEAVDISQFGEFDVYNYLFSVTGNDEAARTAAAGWGGGWLSIYRARADSERVLVQLSLTWDSTMDQQEFLGLYGALLEVRGVEWSAEEDRPEVRWKAEGEYGLVRWNDTTSRVDILVATDEDSLEAVSSPVAG